MKPIETSYNGYRFRSRLEARWAVFFDFIDLKWEYEREGFDLGEGDLYLPDFYLPDYNAWIEIKGEDPFSPLDWEYKDNRLAKFSKEKLLVVFYGIPGDHHGYWYGMDITDSSGGEMYWVSIEWCLSIKTGKACVTTHNDSPSREYYFITDEGYDPTSFIIQEQDILYSTKIAKAFNRAKQARFEYGENHV